MAAAAVFGEGESAAQEALSEFLTNSLLEFNPVSWRYHLHDTIRLFATLTATKMDKELKQGKTGNPSTQQPQQQSQPWEGSGCSDGENYVVNVALWKQRFVEYYYHLLQTASQNCRRGGDDLLLGFKMFDQNRHNVEEAMRLSVKDLKDYTLFCSFARAGHDIFRARLNPHEFTELYESLLAAVTVRVLSLSHFLHKAR